MGLAFDWRYPQAGLEMYFAVQSYSCKHVLSFMLLW